ncbi:MAG: hypothetical protein AB7T63_05910 [Planctomycetota bacterium]
MSVRILAAFVVGGLAGAALMWALGVDRGHVPTPTVGSTVAAGAAETVGPGGVLPGSLPQAPSGTPGLAGAPAPVPRRAPSPPSPTTGAAESAPAPRPRIRPEDRDALIEARTEIVRRAAVARIANAEQQVADAEAIAARLVDDELAAEAARLADLERGGLLDLVRSLDDKWVAPVALLSSAEQLGSYFTPRASGGRVSVERVNDDPRELGHGDTVFVPAGRSLLKASLVRRVTQEGAFPHDLTFEGVGMDRSLLVLDRELDINKDVVNLTFRDLTVDCNDNYFVELRKGFTLRLERCRVVGFDMGAGSSTAFNGGLGAVHATDSRLEAGFGRSAWRGNLWRVSDVLLARLENCTIVGPIGDVGPRRSDSLVVYDRVTFVDLEARERSQLVANERGVRLIDCTFKEGNPPHTRRSERRSLAEINPDWVERK